MRAVVDALDVFRTGIWQVEVRVKSFLGLVLVWFKSCFGLTLSWFGLVLVCVALGLAHVMLIMRTFHAMHRVHVCCAARAAACAVASSGRCQNSVSCVSRGQAIRMREPSEICRAIAR